MTAPLAHPTHDYPDGAWFCTRCRTRRDDPDVVLRCIVDGPIYQDDPRAAAETHVEEYDLGPC